MNAASSDSSALRQPVSCIIEIDDEEITDLYPFLKEVSVDMRRDDATTGTLTFETIRDETCGWIVQDYDRGGPLLVPWRRVTITADFSSHTEEVMRGYIKDVSADYPQDMSSAVVTVNIQDESILLDREHVRNAWSTEEDSMNDGDIVSKIAQDHQLDTQTETGLDNVTLTANSTYVSLMRDRAAANGYEFYVREGTVYFRAPQLESKPQPTILVYAGPATNCLRFKARYIGHQPDQVGVTRAASTGTETVEQTFSPDLPLLGREAANSESMGIVPFAWQLERSSGATEEENFARAQAKINENSWKLEAEGELDGAVYGHVLYNFETVNVDGVGDVYGGTYYVDQVTHRFTPDGYTQSFTLKRNAIGDNSTSSGASRVAGA
jgi:hypothetical protein